MFRSAIHKFEGINVGDLGPFQQILRKYHAEPELIETKICFVSETQNTKTSDHEYVQLLLVLIKPNSTFPWIIHGDAPSKQQFTSCCKLPVTISCRQTPLSWRPESRRYTRRSAHPWAPPYTDSFTPPPQFHLSYTTVSILPTHSLILLLASLHRISAQSTSHSSGSPRSPS